MPMYNPFEIQLNVVLKYLRGKKRTALWLGWTRLGAFKTAASAHPWEAVAFAGVEHINGAHRLICCYVASVEVVSSMYKCYLNVI